jgi:hypothetical protein
MTGAGFLPSAFGGRVFSIPIFLMGQYFRAVNKTKKEVVCPWCIGGGAKLWEWAASPMGALFAVLLRRSSGGGGGDYYGYGTQIVEVNGETPGTVSDALAKIALIEGASVRADPDSVVGRWAGDEVYLVGDYDSSNLYEESFGYRNISRELAETWNSFIDLDDRKFQFDDCGCGQPIEEPVRP